MRIHKSALQRIEKRVGAIDVTYGERLSSLMIVTVLERFRPYALALLRIASGFMFWQHGAQKFGMLEGRVREFPDLIWFAGVLEIVGGPLIAIGLWTQPVAFVLSGEMAVAYFRHARRDIWPILNGGEPAFLFCFIFLLLATTGAGALSVDAWRGRGSRRRRVA